MAQKSAFSSLLTVINVGFLLFHLINLLGSEKSKLWISDQLNFSDHDVTRNLDQLLDNVAETVYAAVSMINNLDQNAANMQAQINTASQSLGP